MTSRIAAATLKAWLSDSREIALLDLREPGQYGAGHPFFAVSLPYSRFELGLPALAPNRRARLVLFDDGDDIAARGAERAAKLGYDNVHVLDGGAPAWGRAGYTLFEGVNLPSKSFGELVERARHTPQITARELNDLQARGADLILLDGRPFEEFHRVNVPGGICCPNGELALRIATLAPGPKTRIVVACAGRTRSIIGAQTLIDFGIPNPVQALENGTQGWLLAGFELERGATRRAPGMPAAPEVGGLDDMRARARRLAESRGVGFATLEDVTAWLGAADRTTYIFDVRTAEAFVRNGPAVAVHAPGGQLVQATDHWVAVRGARLVLLDEEAVRAPVTASWLRQLGHEAYVLDGGVGAARGLPAPASAPALAPPALDSLAPNDLAALLWDAGARLLDLRPSMSYRNGHIAGAVWSIRPRLAETRSGDGRPVVLIAEEDGVAALVARDLRDAGVVDLRRLTGGPGDWTAAGLEVVATPDQPADADRIDHLFFTVNRNQGNAEAARQYLAWEIGLVDRLDAQERGVFQVAPAVTWP